MVEKYLSETDIKKLLQCSRCKRVPNSPPIYMCRTGHHECSACFGKNPDSVLPEETDGSTDTESESSCRKEDNRIGVIFPKASNKRSLKHICAVCKDEVTKTRNIFAECLLTHLEVPKNESRVEKMGYLPSMKINVQETKVQTNYVDCCYNIYSPPCPRYDAQALPVPAFDAHSYPRYHISCPVPQYNFPLDPYIVPDPQPQPLDYADTSDYYPDYDNVTYYSCATRKEGVHDRRNKLNFVPQPSVVSLNGENSKRPIRCPTHLCGRNIAVAALSSHFCFDHPEVPPLNVDFDVGCHLFVDPEAIPFHYGKCLAILLIPNKCEAVSSASHPSIISANKIKNSMPLVVMASKLECNIYPQPSIPGIDEDSNSESLNHGDFQTRGNGKSRLYVIWLAGVDASSSMCTTIQVTEKQGITRSMIYSGPVVSLRASQNTSKVFEHGDCLVINCGALESIVGEKGGFDLNVMVH